MAGRMGGRGRGRPNQSFSTMERELGISKGDTMLSKPILQPSPNYPPLEHKPPPINLSAEMSYLVELKRDFTEYVRESPNNVQAIIVNEDIERFCEDYEETIAEYYTRSEHESRYDWGKMPVELKSSHKRKLPQKNVEKRKKVKVVDIEKKLEELEKTEDTQEIKAEKEDKEQDEEEEDAEDKDVDERVKNEDVEMDDGTDYANEYFENGDNYYSEDENDDGPTF